MTPVLSSRRSRPQEWLPNAQSPIQEKINLTHSSNLDTYGKAHYLQ
ncbi:hypothetical protein [Nostoc sp. UHCC 0302]